MPNSINLKGYFTYLKSCDYHIRSKFKDKPHLRLAIFALSTLPALHLIYQSINRHQVEHQPQIYSPKATEVETGSSGNLEPEELKERPTTGKKVTFAETISTPFPASLFHSPSGSNLSSLSSSTSSTSQPSSISPPLTRIENYCDPKNSPQGSVIYPLVTVDIDKDPITPKDTFQQQVEDLCSDGSNKVKLAEQITAARKADSHILNQKLIDQLLSYLHSLEPLSEEDEQTKPIIEAFSDIPAFEALAKFKEAQVKLLSYLDSNTKGYMKKQALPKPEVLNILYNYPDRECVFIQFSRFAACYIMHFKRAVEEEKKRAYEKLLDLSLPKNVKWSHRRAFFVRTQHCYSWGSYYSSSKKPRNFKASPQSLGEMCFGSIVTAKKKNTFLKHAIDFVEDLLIIEAYEEIYAFLKGSEGVNGLIFSKSEEGLRVRDGEAPQAGIDLFVRLVLLMLQVYKVLDLPEEDKERERTMLLNSLHRSLCLAFKGKEAYLERLNEFKSVEEKHRLVEALYFLAKGKENYTGDQAQQIYQCLVHTKSKNPEIVEMINDVKQNTPFKSKRVNRKLWPETPISKTPVKG